MNIIKEKCRKLKINENLKIIIIMSFVVLGIMILLPVIFLSNSSSSNNLYVFNLNNSNIIKNSGLSFPYDGKVKLYRREKGSVEEIALEEYIKGVVASEMPANFDEEALKAQAVAARTYYINKRVNPCKDAQSNGAEICDSTDCQVYMDKQERVSKWSKKDSETNWNKINEAVESTKGEVLTYDGVILEYPQYFAVSSGKTEDAVDVFSMNVPYLKSTESSGEEIAPKYETTSTISVDDFINKIKAKYSDAEISRRNIRNCIEVESYTQGGSVKEIRVGNKNLRGIELRKILNLNSTNFSVSYKGNDIIFSCKGYGHGVGMSQWGANAMAKNGAGYDEILKHYYNGVDIEKINYQ
ncbi:stage II sporulation protein D [uncultured Clostridium sp.]|uniref:stage II sporulation protein D n=1 Tax=uncultured Clostridium sp. TaxID=59620 RepID=UPI0025CE3F6C|nr:stage II sporulation protein D [uncultured Clostridium sp.]